jgi:hypothetical protein
MYIEHEYHPTAEAHDMHWLKTSFSVLILLAALGMTAEAAVVTVAPANEKDALLAEFRIDALQDVFHKMILETGNKGSNGDNRLTITQLENVKTGNKTDVSVSAGEGWSFKVVTYGPKRSPTVSCSVPRSKKGLMIIVSFRTGMGQVYHRCPVPL